MSLVNDFLESFGYEQIIKPKEVTDNLRPNSEKRASGKEDQSIDYVKQDLKKKHSISKNDFSINDAEEMGREEGEYNFPERLPKNNVERAIKRR